MYIVLAVFQVQHRRSIWLYPQRIIQDAYPQQHSRPSRPIRLGSLLRRNSPNRQDSSPHPGFAPALLLIFLPAPSSRRGIRVQRQFHTA